MVFRSVELKLPKPLLGWESYGTIQISKPITGKGLPEDLQGMRIKLSTTAGKGKLRPKGDGTWAEKRGREIRLGVERRFSSNMIVQLYTKGHLKNAMPAYGILWLKDIPDGEEFTADVTIFKGKKSDYKRARVNCIDDGGEKVGTVSIPLKFFEGMGDYHRHLKDDNIKNVMQCLDTAADNKDMRKAMAQTKVGDEQSGSDTDSSSDDDDSDSLENSPDRGPLRQIKDYKENRKALHRQHRGVMQWKVARTAQYVKDKVVDGVDGVTDQFKRHERQPDIETEV